MPISLSDHRTVVSAYGSSMSVTFINPNMSDPSDSHTHHARIIFSHCESLESVINAALETARTQGVRVHCDGRGNDTRAVQKMEMPTETAKALKITEALGAFGKIFPVKGIYWDRVQHSIEINFNDTRDRKAFLTSAHMTAVLSALVQNGDKFGAYNAEEIIGKLNAELRIKLTRKELPAVLEKRKAGEDARLQSLSIRPGFVESMPYTNAFNNCRLEVELEPKGTRLKVIPFLQSNTRLEDANRIKIAKETAQKLAAKLGGEVIAEDRDQGSFGDFSANGGGMVRLNGKNMTQVLASLTKENLLDPVYAETYAQIDPGEPEIETEEPAVEEAAEETVVEETEPSGTGKKSGHASKVIKGKKPAKKTVVKAAKPVKGAKSARRR